MYFYYGIYFVALGLACIWKDRTNRQEQVTDLYHRLDDQSRDLRRAEERLDRYTSKSKAKRAGGAK